MDRCALTLVPLDSIKVHKMLNFLEVPFSSCTYNHSENSEFRGHLPSATVILVSLLEQYALAEIRKWGFTVCEYSL